MNAISDLLSFCIYNALYNILMSKKSSCNYYNIDATGINMGRFLLTTVVCLIVPFFHLISAM